MLGGAYDHYFTFQHLYLLRRSATDSHSEDGYIGYNVSTPLPSEKVCDIYQKLVKVMRSKFQHLYLLGRSATGVGSAADYLLSIVSTPLPSGKVCDPITLTQQK